MADQCRPSDKQVVANRKSDSLKKWDMNHACSLTEDFGIDSDWQ